jgi:Protein of unknown function (DUF2934)
MEEKTKKKRVRKKAIRKKIKEVKAAEPVSTAAIPAVTPIAREALTRSAAPAAETKKPRKSSKTKSASNAKSVSRAKSASNTPKLTAHVPTFEQVQLRAYFISERRRKLGLPGDESRDWLTAEQELREELSV